jgi:predicted HicB family RNase H-like nuclease
MNKLFNVGDVVYADIEERENLDLSKLTPDDIESNFEEGIIKFIDESGVGIRTNHKNIEMYPASALYSQEFFLEQKNLAEENYSKLEKELMLEVQKGVQILKAANLKAQEQNLSLSELDNAARLLRGLIDDIGWSSSSLSC